MRPIKVSLAATGNSRWVPVDYMEAGFSISYYGRISPGASLTWGVQRTYDDLSVDAERQVTVTRAAGVATVIDTAHGCTTGDSVFIFGAGSILDSLNGSDITVVDANTYTYVVTNSGATVGAAGTRAKTLRVQIHSVLAAQAGNKEGNDTTPVRAVRLIATIVSGSVDLDILQGLEI